MRDGNFPVDWKLSEEAADVVRQDQMGPGGGLRGSQVLRGSAPIICNCHSKFVPNLRRLYFYSVSCCSSFPDPPHSLSTLYSLGFEKMNTESKFKHRWQANWRKSLDKPSLWPMSREYLPRIAQLLHYCPLSPARVSNRPSTCNT